MENRINEMKDKTKEFWENNKDKIKKGAKWCAYLSVIGFLVVDNIKKGKRIDELTDICNLKDSLYCEAISDGLRHGSSYAGRQMNYRKQLLGKVA